MQQSELKIIFDMAVKELPTRHQFFHNEEAVLYRGFKISKSFSGEYSWYDTRYSNYYEPVDPKVTQNVLEHGFCVTLEEVMLHNDEDKILNINREIEVKDAQIAYWTKESSKLWTDYNRKKQRISKNDDYTDEDKQLKKNNLKKRYEKKKTLYQKKRRIISEERDELKNDRKFFEARVKLYNMLKP